MPHIARAAVRTVRFAYNNPDDSQIGRGGRAFAEAVAADPALNTVLKVDLYGNAQLGDDLTMLKACVKGTLDGAFVASSLIANIASDVGLFNAPYLFRDVAAARAALDGKIGQDYMALSRAKGLPVLAWGENGLRHITANRPIRTPADLRGLKIRVPQSELMMAGFRALGANAAPLSFPLLREALRAGEFEAQENAISTVEAAKLYEVQKYLCLTGHIYDALGFIVSADLLEDLTEAQQAAIASCARKGAAVSREVADAANRDGIGRLRALGMTVVDDVDVAAFRAASKPFLLSLASTYGADRIDRLLANA
jgi:tripartite ATP-independent transporter DctP family solute receptor